jgi:RNA polymerase sigma-70 factor (ECF subfamily)
MKKFFASLLGLSDEQAMWRVQMQDDPEAFAHLMRKWEGPIQRLCARMTCDSHKGQDLAQETFAKVYAKRKDYQPTGKFSTWVWRIALNVSYDELRRVQRRPEGRIARQTDDDAECEEHAIEHGTPAKSLLKEEMAAKVRSALAALPEHYRAVLVMRHYEDLKFSEIAEILGIPEGTVKSRMAYGLSQLHRTLANEFEPRKEAHARRESLIL